MDQKIAECRETFSTYFTCRQMFPGAVLHFPVRIIPLVGPISFTAVLTNNDVSVIQNPFEMLQ